MKPSAMGLIVILLFLFCFTAGCSENRVSLWEKHCEACHDGKTMLNGRVVMDKGQITARYKTLEEFSHACSGAPSCMNIVKHEEKLLRKVGTELGLKNSAEK